MFTEFDLIERFFTQDQQRSDVMLGVGDDCALLQPPKNQLLAVSTDTLISGVHFPSNTNPYDIGYKSLAVNLSDLAAMGAEPAWVMLALTLPKVNVNWLANFKKGFFELINYCGLQLIGGDITRGSLSITAQVFGFVPKEKALRRDGAKPGDRIYVTGTLGDAGLALKLLRQGKKPSSFLLQRLNRPEPRIAAGLALRGIASSAIDISDGLAADLGHILQASKVGAKVIMEDMPGEPGLALNSGDDYELCFTVPEKKEAKLVKALGAINCPYSCIGAIEAKSGLRLQYRNGKSYRLKTKGYKHF